MKVQGARVLVTGASSGIGAATADLWSTAIEGDRFETYAPDLSPIVEWKTANIDQFIEGVASQ